MDKKRLTSENGKPIADNQNIQTAGVRGPAMLQDVWYLEKLAHFDREVIPERRMHAKGSGAFGTFTVTHDITKYTRASIFSQVGKKTDCLVRFSTVAGERGAADAERDIRGFAMKFYTDTGNWDLVGNNTPVFFLRDPLKFPDLNHAIKRDPRTGMRSANNNWDFWTLLPEALHQVTITMSPRGIPASFRHMHGFGSHTFSFYDKDNKRTWVKFHFRTLQGIKNLTDAEAEAVIAKDRESNQRDLFEAIERGDYPRWLMQVQLMTEEEARNYKINPFDLTKVWYHGDFPLHDVGILELNRNPDNFFAEIEQAAFNPDAAVGKQGDGGALRDAEGQHAQQALGVYAALVLLHPDAALELVGLLNEKGRGARVQTNLIVDGDFLCNHSLILPNQTNGILSILYHPNPIRQSTFLQTSGKTGRFVRAVCRKCQFVRGRRTVLT